MFILKRFGSQKMRAVVEESVSGIVQKSAQLKTEAVPHFDAVLS